MTLTEYAARELRLAGLFGEDSDYNGKLGEWSLDIVKLFASQGHSGGSAFMVTEIVSKLMRYEPLTPLTYGPDEWIDQTGVGGGTHQIWQNCRDSKIFSEDGGKTHYSIDSS